MVQRPLYSRKSSFYFEEIPGRGSLEVRIALNVEYVPTEVTSKGKRGGRTTIASFES